jgi:hypothetical protein
LINEYESYFKYKMTAETINELGFWLEKVRRFPPHPTPLQALLGVGRKFTFIQREQENPERLETVRYLD